MAVFYGDTGCHQKTHQGLVHFLRRQRLAFGLAISIQYRPAVLVVPDATVFVGAAIGFILCKRAMLGPFSTGVICTKQRQCQRQSERFREALINSELPAVQGCAAKINSHRGLIFVRKPKIVYSVSGSDNLGGNCSELP